jgi:ADP-heptose:LPS heptosyltransferase
MDASVDVDDTRPVRNLVVWSMDRLGDVVRGTAAIRSLKRRFASARLVMVAAARSAPILQENPCIQDLRVVEKPLRIFDHYRVMRALKGTRWDLGVLLEADPHWTMLGAWWFRYLGVRKTICFDFGAGAPAGFVGVPLGETGSWIEQFGHLAAVGGVGIENLETEVHLNAKERAWAEQFLARHGVDVSRPFFLIHPGGDFLTVSRQWSPRAFGELIELVHSRWSHPIVVTGIAEERAIVEEIRAVHHAPFVDLCGKLSLRQLAAVIDFATLCVMNDTGPLHVAQALTRPAVAILGPTAPEVVGIAGSTLPVRMDLPCSPCAFYAGWRACTNPSRWECLHALTPAQVFKAVERQMGRRAS